MQRILAVAMGAGPKHGDSGVFRGIIGNKSQQVQVRPYVTGLIKGLEARGLKPGQDFEIDYATCEPRTLKPIVQQAIGEHDAIFAMSTSAVKAAMAISKTIPIVFPSISDPIKDGLMKSVAPPGVNATGVRPMRSQTIDDCLELFKVTVPSLKKVYGLHKKNYIPATRAMKVLKAVAKRCGVQFKSTEVSSHKAIADALAKIAKTEKPGQAGVLVMPDDLVLSASRMVAQSGLDLKIPTFFPTTDWVRSQSPSALGGYGVPQVACGEAAAAYMYKVLKDGASPKDLPVKRIGGFEWAVNRQVARAIGLEIPNSVVKAADRVV